MVYFRPQFAMHNWNFPSYRNSEDILCICTNLTNPLQTLPSELKSLIGSFCTPGSLASLAQAHPSNPGEAERTLYHTLYIYTNHKEVACLDLLSVNLQKAFMVNSLTVEFPVKRNDESRILSALFEALYHVRIYLICRPSAICLPITLSLTAIFCTGSSIGYIS